MIGLGLGINRAALPVQVPSGYILLTDSDGVLLTDADGAYLMEKI
jgi:hypothetical protein